MKTAVTNEYNLQKGTKIFYTPSNTDYLGKEFKIEKVTEKNVSWYVGFVYNSAYGKNKMRMAHTSLRLFNEGIKKGIYKIL